jgi:hypothetical protein
MNIYQQAHETLKECTYLNFFNLPEIQACELVWHPIKLRLKENKEKTMTEINDQNDDIKESIQYLAKMFGNAHLLES